jgi:hypothetical protein
MDGVQPRDRTSVAVDPRDDTGAEYGARWAGRMFLVIMAIGLVSTIAGMILTWLLELGPVSP